MRALDPEDALCVLRTDLSVEVLPSERVESELEQARVATLRERQRREQRELRASEAATELQRLDAVSDTASPERPFRVLLRFPDGTRAERASQPEFFLKFTT